MKLKDFLKEVLDLGRDDVFKVDVKETFSFFNTEKEHQEKVLAFFTDYKDNGRFVNVEVTEDRGGSRGGGRDRNRGGGGRRRDGGNSGGRRRDDKPRGERRSSRRSDDSSSNRSDRRRSSDSGSERPSRSNRDKSEFKTSHSRPTRSRRKE